MWHICTMHVEEYYKQPHPYHTYIQCIGVAIPSRRILIGMTTPCPGLVPRPHWERIWQQVLWQCHVQEEFNQLLFTLHADNCPWGIQSVTQSHTGGSSGDIRRCALLIAACRLSTVHAGHWIKPFRHLACGNEALAHERTAAQYKMVKLRREVNHVDDSFFCSQLVST